MVPQTFLLGLLTLISLRSVSAALIHNCSREAPVAPSTYKSYFPSYGPQIGGRNGWEEWTIAIPDNLNQSMFHFRWTRGNPAALISLPQKASFSVFYEKTGFKADLKGSLEFNTVGDSYLSISMGKNYLSFDGTKGPFGHWNVSVDIEGLIVDAIIDPVTPSVPFVPTLDGEDGLLVPGYHVSNPVARGHTDATFTLPSGLSWTIQTVSTLKHVYAYRSVQSLVSTYTRVATFFQYNSLNWYVAKAKGGKDTTAAQFVYGASDFSEFTTKYQITNEPSILSISSSVSSESRNYAVTFAGCQETTNNPYTFNSTSGAYLGGFTDSAGGKTEYWDLGTQAFFFVGDKSWSNDKIGSLGLVEVYTSA